MSFLNIVTVMLCMLAPSKILATNPDEFKNPFPPIKSITREEPRATSTANTTNYTIVNASSQAPIEFFSEYGLSWVAQNKFEEAEEAFKKVIELNEKSDLRSSARLVYTSLFQLGEINFIRANFDAALTYYKEALFIPWADKDHSQIFSAIGDAYLKLNKFQDAVENYNYSTKFREKDFYFKATIYQKLGDFHCLHGDGLKAVRAYEQAINLLDQFYTAGISDLTKRLEAVSLLCPILDDYCKLTISPIQEMRREFYREELEILQNQTNRNKLR